MIFCGLWWRLKNSLVLNSDINDRLKKLLLLFCHAEMVFVRAWSLDHFTREYVPLINSIWIITPVGLLHVWVKKFKASLIFFKLSILVLNNVIWVDLFAILFDEAQHVVKISTTGYVPVFYEVINPFIKPQNFQLMGLYLTVTVCDGLLMFFLYFVCKLLPNMRKQYIAAVPSEVFSLWLLTWKYYLIHPLFINVIAIFSRILRSIYWVSRCDELAQLILMSVIFLTTKDLYNIGGLLVIFRCPAHFPGACPRFFINVHNA